MSGTLWLNGPVEVELGFDAEFCPDPVPGGYPWCMVYAGGSSAARPWDVAELARVAHLRRLPVWVPTPGADDPVTAGRAFYQWLGQHGVPSIQDPPHRPMHVLWDLETGVLPDPAWVNAACDVLADAGYWNLIYGSQATVFGQPPRSGYVVADPATPYRAHLVQHAQVVGTQWAFDVRVPGGLVDLDVLDASVAARLWLPS